MTLEELRKKLDSIDTRLLESVAERQAVIREIAQTKQATGSPLRDYKREREVFQIARRNAERVGISPEVAESLMRQLIRYSLTMQEQRSMSVHAHGDGRRALIIGGSGKMGGWFAQFLDSQGFEVEVADPRAEAGTGVLADWRQSDLRHDYIIVATPLGATNGILLELADRRPPGVVFDVGSLKSPLRSGLETLRKAGVRVSSLHPMFGPDVELLSGRHVLFVDVGHREALESARALFNPTMAEQAVMTLDEHDRLIAYVLGLSHAVNIAFFTALAQSGESAPQLLKLSSTTFDAQFNIARNVASESPTLYFEIQHLNDFGAESLDALAKSVEAIRDSVRSGDEDRFTQLMIAGHEYTKNRRSISDR